MSKKPEYLKEKRRSFQAILELLKSSNEKERGRIENTILNYFEEALNRAYIRGRNELIKNIQTAVSETRREDLFLPEDVDL